MRPENDIEERVLRDFDAASADLAIEKLTKLDAAERVTRCIVVAADGSLDRLEHDVELARKDSREVIVAGESDSEMRCIRDLRVSFTN